MRRQGTHIILAFLFTTAVVALGYVLLGFLPMCLFAFGFVGGFLLWLFTPDKVTFSEIKLPYFSSLGLFVLHRMEEHFFGFFPALSRITGVPVPQPSSIFAILLWMFAGAWLLIPYLLGKESPFGYYLAWTFFTSMGVTELAHFGFPILSLEPFGYFPGMATVILLAPVAWFGIWRMLVGGNAEKGR
jgi:hypothetical protein